MKLRALAVAALAAAALTMVGGERQPVEAQSCREVAYKVTADAAPVAARLNQGADVPMPIAYAHVEQETAPRYVYSEAGSTSLGALEGIVLQPRQLTGLLGGMVPLPFDLPEIPDIPGAPAVPAPPGRAASGYPVSSLPPEAIGDWTAGTSRTAASADRAFAASEAVAGGAASRIESVLACETLSVHASWTLGAIELPGLGALAKVGQELVIEVGPTGRPKVDVQTTVLHDALGLDRLLGDLPDQLIGDILKAGGQDFEISEPTVEVDADGVRVSSRPIAVRFAPPEGSQAVSASVGLLEVDVRRLGIVPPGSAFTPPSDDDPEDRQPAAAADPGAAPATPAPAAPVPQTPPAGGGTRSGVPTVVDHVSSVGDAWWPGPLAGLLALLVYWRVALARRSAWPTADFALTRLERAARWFHTTYLRW